MNSTHSAASPPGGHGAALMASINACVSLIDRSHSATTSALVILYMCIAFLLFWFLPLEAAEMAQHGSVRLHAQLSRDAICVEPQLAVEADARPFACVAHLGEADPAVSHRFERHARLGGHLGQDPIDGGAEALHGSTLAVHQQRHSSPPGPA